MFAINDTERNGTEKKQQQQAAAATSIQIVIIINNNKAYHIRNFNADSLNVMDYVSFVSMNHFFQQKTHYNR